MRGYNVFGYSAATTPLTTFSEPGVSRDYREFDNENEAIAFAEQIKTRHSRVEIRHNDKKIHQYIRWCKDRGY